mmetsp:Transcript_11690/g.25414  ORF Transcript_11690/g.25414 Transcript_11690/m.25414 type:complete len:200 (+) Transcript_11690:194-793(+)
MITGRMGYGVALHHARCSSSRHAPARPRAPARQLPAHRDARTPCTHRPIASPLSPLRHKLPRAFPVPPMPQPLPSGGRGAFALVTQPHQTNTAATKRLLPLNTSHTAFLGDHCTKLPAFCCHLGTVPRPLELTGVSNPLGNPVAKVSYRVWAASRPRLGHVSAAPSRDSSRVFEWSCEATVHCSAKWPLASQVITEKER